MPCKKVDPSWSVDSNVYHVCSNCTTGNNIEPDKRRTSRYPPPGKSLDTRCRRIMAGEIPR